MEPSTVSSCILTLHREFAAYTTQRLQELGLSFGLIYFVIYVRKASGLYAFGTDQRSASGLGPLPAQPEQAGRRRLSDERKEWAQLPPKLTQRGENAFVVCHQVFIDWDAQSLGGLTAQERQQLLTLLQKAVQKKVCK